MRSALRVLSAGDLGFSEYDVEETLILCRRLVASHWQATHGPLADLPENDQESIEVIADTNVRVFHEVQFVWHYGLLRLQGIFEGLIDQDFLRATEWSLGLKARLRSMKAAGYTLADDDFSALMQWSRLRNALVHRPPTSDSLARLEERDVAEFAELIERILQRWRIESQTLAPRELDYGDYAGC